MRMTPWRREKSEDEDDNKDVKEEEEGEDVENGNEVAGKSTCSMA